MMAPIELSIIIVNWNTKQLLLNCIASIYNSVRTSFEIIVVDNGSNDGSLTAVARSYPEVIRIDNNANLGFAKANNRGIRVMHGRYAVLLNSDTVVRENSLETMLDFMEHHPGAGMCGPQLMNEDGSQQISVGNFPTLLSEFMSKKLIRILLPGKYKQTFKPTADFKGPQAVDYIVGACMMVRKSAMETVGLFDEDYFFLLEEVDWCYRMQESGWHVYHLPKIGIYHMGGQSMKEINLKVRIEFWRSRYLYLKKSLDLSKPGWYSLLLLGFLQNFYQFSLYTLLNLVTVFSLKRLRRRWAMFVHLMLWHLRGRPDSMGIPR